ncbi:MAG: YicC family protein [Bacteroidetes bacterium]|nr:YicC family protein [Bacteroidota bacterium]MBK8681298.1 YicC family protein [Bacteroidota bacterium]
MILSMTGYGRVTFELNGKNTVIELRALNSKVFDMNLRLPTILREHEMDIRNIISREIVRGKIDCIIAYEQFDDQKNGELNSVIIKDYYKQLKQLASELNADETKIFELIFRLPNVITSTKEELTEKQWKQIEKLVEDACNAVQNFRTTEGEQLKVDLHKRNKLICEILAEIEVLDPERVVTFKNSLMTDLRSSQAAEQVDINRFEQEVIYYLEKMDITEEITRLRSHCDYFEEVLKEAVTEKGKKLGFITQEMGREINTIGSKAYHAEMQKCVVRMKDELEKIKEQLNNVL